MPQSKKRKKEYGAWYQKKNRGRITEQQRYRRQEKAKEEKILKAEIEFFNRTNPIYSLNRRARKITGVDEVEWEGKY